MASQNNISRLYNLPVVTLEEGIRLGKVDDVFIDRPTKQMLGISIKNSLLGKDEPSYVALDRIRKIGKDVIIVTDQDSMIPLTDDLSAKSIQKLKGFDITTQDGANIGKLVGLNFNPVTGTVSEILLDGLRMIRVEIDEIVLGPDVIIVPSDYASRIAEVETERDGLMTRLFGPEDMSGVFRETYAGLKGSVTRGKTAGKIAQTLRGGKDKAKETMLSTSRKIQETLDEIRSKKKGEARQGDSGSGSFESGDTQRAGIKTAQPYTSKQTNPQESPEVESDEERRSDHNVKTET